MAQILGLSREYLFVPFDEMNFDVADLTVNQMAFMSAGVEPTESDWEPAIVVDSLHALYSPLIGEGLAILIGPDRGDAVTTLDLPDADYQVWIDAAVTGSDERVVRIAGLLEVVATT